MIQFEPTSVPEVSRVYVRRRLYSCSESPMAAAVCQSYVRLCSKSQLHQMPRALGHLQDEEEFIYNLYCTA